MAAHATTEQTVTLTRDEAELVARTMDLAFAAADALNLTLRGREHVQAIRERLSAPLGQLYRMPIHTGEDLSQPSRAQELAADAMAAKHGRSGVRMQADGSCVISGLIDDIELEQVCINRDGTERWRRPSR